MTKMDPAAQVVTDPKADNAAVLAAFNQISATAPPTLWSGVANDERFPIEHRSLVAWELIKRHVHPGITLGDTAHQLAGARWLEHAQLEKVTEMAGELPIEIPERGAAFVVHLARSPQSTLPDLGAYLAIDRDCEATVLRAMLTSPSTNTASIGVHVVGVAMFPDPLTLSR